MCFETWLADIQGEREWKRWHITSCPFHWLRFESHWREQSRVEVKPYFYKQVCGSLPTPVCLGAQVTEPSWTQGGHFPSWTQDPAILRRRPALECPCWAMSSVVGEDPPGHSWGEDAGHSRAEGTCLFAEHTQIDLSASPLLLIRLFLPPRPYTASSSFSSLPLAWPWLILAQTLFVSLQWIHQQPCWCYLQNKSSIRPLRATSPSPCLSQLPSSPAWKPAEPPTALLLPSSSEQRDVLR